MSSKTAPIWDGKRETFNQQASLFISFLVTKHGSENNTFPTLIRDIMDTRRAVPVDLGSTVNAVATRNESLNNMIYAHVETFLSKSPSLYQKLREKARRADEIGDGQLLWANLVENIKPTNKHSRIQAFKAFTSARWGEDEPVDTMIERMRKLSDNIAAVGGEAIRAR